MGPSAALKARRESWVDSGGVGDGAHTLAPIARAPAHEGAGNHTLVLPVLTRRQSRSNLRNASRGAGQDQHSTDQWEPAVAARSAATALRSTRPVAAISQL